MLTSPRHPTLTFDATNERAIIALVTQWRNCHARYRVCAKRINWNRRDAATIEKRRRKEKWDCVARILEIEHTCLRWCARATQHPDIYTPKTGKRTSRLMRLRHQYDQNRRTAHHATGPRASRVRAQLREERKGIVLEMRAITREWMAELYRMVFSPDHHPPRAIPLHPAELMPRKLKNAQKRMHAEVAA